jgi:hypothetical protein
LRVKSLQLELDFKEIQINVLNSSLNNSYIFIIQDDKIVFYLRAFFSVEGLVAFILFYSLELFLLHIQVCRKWRVHYLLPYRGCLNVHFYLKKKAYQ